MCNGRIKSGIIYKTKRTQGAFRKYEKYAKIILPSSEGQSLTSATNTNEVG